MNRPLLPDVDEDEFRFTHENFFAPCGSLARCNTPDALLPFQKKWIGPDYSIRMGRFKGQRLSSVTCPKWLTWAMNRFLPEQPPASLQRALIDQFNSLFV